jgi:hypothetical protein
MPIPVTTPNAVDTYGAMRAGALNVRAYCLNIQAGAADGVPAGSLLTLLAGAQSLLAQFAAIGGVTTAIASAIQSYIQSTYGTPTEQVFEDTQASATALQALVAAIVVDYPKDSGGHLLDRTMDAQGNVTVATLQTAHLPTVLPAIAAWLATIV